MSETEKRHIEKEGAAITSKCELFSEYLIGLNFTTETDHKPLVLLLGSKDISELPARVQRFHVHLMRLSYKIHNVPSMAPIDEDGELEESSTMFVHTIMNFLPTRVSRLVETTKQQR